MVLCVMHGALMRMPESEIGAIDKPVRDIMEAEGGFGADKKRAVETANSTLRTLLGAKWKYALTVDSKTKKARTPELSGQAGRALMWDILKEKARKDGKPDNVIVKIVKGQMQKVDDLLCCCCSFTLQVC